MSRLRSFVRLLPELWRTLVARPVTVRFPFVPLEAPLAFRGKVVIDARLCKGCGLCVRDCPASALELEREGRERFRLIHYRDRCAYCGQCEDDCPTGAIRLLGEIVPATPHRDTLTQVLVEYDASMQRD